MAGGSVVRVAGSPEKLVDEVFGRVAAEIDEKVRAALEAAKEILRKSYEDNLSRLESELQRAAREAREIVESTTAKQEVELRKTLARIRAEAVEEALREALARLKSYVGEEDYTRFLARLVADAAAKAGGAVTLVPVRGDEELLRRAVRQAELPRGARVEVAEETVEGLGGFIARTVDGVSLDYRLEVVLSQAIEEARARIIETLFK